MEKPNISDYFRKVGELSKEGRVESHDVIKLLTDFNIEWEKSSEEEAWRAYNQGTSDGYSNANSPHPMGYQGVA